MLISGNDQELWGVNIEFTLYELKWTIDAILQHMGFYHTTENPCVMMRENHKIKSCECIIIYQDELYIALKYTSRNSSHCERKMIIKDLIFLMIQEEQ